MSDGLAGTFIYQFTRSVSFSSVVGVGAGLGASPPPPPSPAFFCMPLIWRLETTRWARPAASAGDAPPAGFAMTEALWLCSYECTLAEN